MKTFGLACEGITDQITLENILCGYFKADIDDDDITYLQPLSDATRQAQDGSGGWNELLKYLTTERFRDDVLAVKYLIIQVDTDISEQEHFNVSHSDADNKPLAVETLVANVTDRLREKIIEGDSKFYAQNQERILFCISVHSLECWLLALHQKKTPKTPKIINCYAALERELNKVKGFKLEKNQRCYDALSQGFLKTKVLSKVANTEPSLAVFIHNLEALTLPL